MPAISGGGMGLTNNSGTGAIWTQAAAGAASGIFDRLAQRIGVNYDNRKQLEQQEKLNKLQIASESQLYDIQSQKQLEFWKKTSYPSQMEQLNKAGLNPGLLYGMSGGGGITTGGTMPSASAGTAENPKTHTTGMAIMQNSMLAGQLQLLQAQKENIQADTNLKNVNAQKTKGVDTQLQEKQISSLTQGIENQKAIQKLTEIQTDISEIDKKIKENTQEDVTNQISNQARKTQQELEILINQNALTTEQATNARQIATENLINLQLQNEQSRKNLSLTDQQIQKIAVDISNQTNLANMQLKINDLPKSVQTIIQTLFTILHMAR